jgi:hypothetical protein
MDIGKSAPRFTFSNDPTSLSITSDASGDKGEKDEDDKIIKIINMYKNQLK